AIVPIGHQEFIACGEIKHSLRLGHATDALEAFSTIKVHHLYRVVSEGGDEEQTTFDVDREMIEAALNRCQRDGLNEFQRTCGFGRGRNYGEQGNRDAPD